jgi:hypothetical protein
MSYFPKFTHFRVIIFAFSLTIESTKAAEQFTENPTFDTTPSLIHENNTTEENTLQNDKNKTEEIQEIEFEEYYFFDSSNGRSFLKNFAFFLFMHWYFSPKMD